MDLYFLTRIKNFTNTLQDSCCRNNSSLYFLVSGKVSHYIKNSLPSFSSIFLTANLLSLFFLSGSLVWARNTTDVVYYHYRASKFQNALENYPLFPSEPEIADFPPPIAHNENDLNIIQDYYLAIVKAYEKVLATIQPQPFIIHKESQVELAHTYIPSIKIPDQAKEAKGTYDVAVVDQIKDLNAKINFYRSLAKASTELNSP